MRLVACCVVDGEEETEEDEQSEWDRGAREKVRGGVAILWGKQWNDLV